MKIINKIAAICLITLGSGVVHADGKARPTLADRAAQDIFQTVAQFYGDVDTTLTRGWGHLELRDDQIVWLLRSSFSSYGVCLSDGHLANELPPGDDLEAWCAEMLVSGLEELLGPARWQQLHAAYKP